MWNPSIRAPRRAFLPLVVALTVATAALTSGANADAPPDAGVDQSPWHVAGSWRVVANADDIRALARDGDVVWAATRRGGVARWSADALSIRQYVGPQDGLPCSDVRDVLKWRGIWWFATCDGLMDFDAQADRFVGVPAELASPSVTALAIDDQDRLWVASEPVWDAYHQLADKATPGAWIGGGVAWTNDGQHWQRAGLADGLPSTSIRDIALWRGGMFLATAPYPRWVPPSIDPDGHPVPGRWDQVGGGVARWDGAAWTSWNRDTAPDLADMTTALAAGADALWVGTFGRGLAAWDGSRWHGQRDCGDDAACIPDNFVTALAAGADGALWVATARFNGQGSGVALLDHRGTPGNAEDDAWFALRGDSAPPGALVHAILPDTDATVWFGSADRDPEDIVHGRGLARLQADRRSMATVRTTEVGDGALADNDITAVATHPTTGELWIGTGRSGLAVQGADGRWRHITRASTGGGLASDAIADIAIEPSGVVWVATRQLTYDAAKRTWVDGGLSRYDGAAWTRLAGPDSGLPSDHLSALALDGRGKLWVGTGATDRGPKEHAYRGWGLAVVDTRSLKWERTYTYPQLASNNVTDLAVRGSELWVATAYFFYIDPRPGGAQFDAGGGVSVLDLDTSQWRTYDADDGLPVAIRGRGASTGRALLDARSILLDEDGGAWVGSLAFPDGEFVPDVMPNGVIDRIGDIGAREVIDSAGAVVALARDATGAVWAATARDGARVRATASVWLRGPGAVADAALTSMAFDARGAWLGTAGSGLLRLEPPAPPTPTTPPPPEGTSTPGPSPTPGGAHSQDDPHGFVLRSPYALYLPLLRRDNMPRIVTLPIDP